MANYEILLQEGIIGIDEYQELKARCLGLTALSSVSFAEESSYDPDFTLTRVEAMSTGRFLEQHYTVRAGFSYVPASEYESLIVFIKCAGVNPGNTPETIFGSKVGVTVIHNQVRFAWEDIHLPFPKQHIPEAQPERTLDSDTREHFETWEHEIRKRDDLTLINHQLLLAELTEIANLE